MSRFSLLLFDLDGTITDSQRGITRSVQYALQQLGIPAPDPAAFRPFIGPPLFDSFRKLPGFDDARAIQAIHLYREYYTATGIFENELYPGIPELLSRLHGDGRTLALATTKPTVYAERILAHFNLTDCFAHVTGSNMDGSRVDKDELVRDVLAAFPHISPNRAVMIGDREYDILGARANGILSVAVTWGYGPCTELRTARPDYLVRSVRELEALVG